MDTIYYITIQSITKAITGGNRPLHTPVGVIMRVEHEIRKHGLDVSNP